MVIRIVASLDVVSLVGFKSHTPSRIRLKYPERMKIAENLVGYARKVLTQTQRLNIKTCHSQTIVFTKTSYKHPLDATKERQWLSQITVYYFTISQLQTIPLSQIIDSSWHLSQTLILLFHNHRQYLVTNNRLLFCFFHNHRQYLCHRSETLILLFHNHGQYLVTDHKLLVCFFTITDNTSVTNHRFLFYFFTVTDNTLSQITDAYSTF